MSAEAGHQLPLPSSLAAMPSTPWRIVIVLGTQDGREDERRSQRESDFGLDSADSTHAGATCRDTVKACFAGVPPFFRPPRHLRCHRRLQAAHQLCPQCPGEWSVHDSSTRLHLHKPHRRSSHQPQHIAWSLASPPMLKATVRHNTKPTAIFVKPRSP